MTDLLEYADNLRKYYRESSPCYNCGSPDPAILRSSPPSCSDCNRRCLAHKQWLPCQDCEAEIVAYGLARRRRQWSESKRRWRALGLATGTSPSAQ